MMPQVTRRSFAAMLPAASLAMCVPARASTGPQLPSAAQVIDRMHGQLKVEGVEVLAEGKTVDRFIVGNPMSPVRGIATTFMCTFDVMRRAHEAGLSLIVTHEPTFWNHLDAVSEFESDPTYQLKKRYAEEHGLVVWRFHDHWHMRKPDPIVVALCRKLGFATVGSLDSIIELTPIRLVDLVRRIRVALDTSNIRYWGNPDRIVRRLRWGGHPLRQIAGQESDVFLWAEPKEFNTLEYFRDAGELGLDRSIIGATHELIEEWGMLEPCADWICELVPEVPVLSLRTPELFRTV